MNILFRREQSSAKVGKPIFKLWCQIELDDNEQAIVKKYHFDQHGLVGENQKNLLRNSALLGLFAGLIAYIVLDIIFPSSLAQILGLLAAGGSGYWFFHNNRDLIYVRDLIHGRHFSCPTVIDLAKKEGELTNIVYAFRQVMESAKHWDGTQAIPIEALPVEEARELIRRL